MRSILSAVAVLLLGVFAYLFFTDYFRAPQPDKPGDLLTNTAFPPPLPAPLIERPPVQPVVAPQPVAPVAPQPAPVAPVVIAPPVPAPIPAPVVAQPRQTHVVQRGDTLSSISRMHFGTEIHFSKIAAANGLKNQDRIRVGQVLVLPEISGTLPHPETAARPDEPEHATSTLPPDFEPIPPTLNITAPRK